MAPGAVLKCCLQLPLIFAVSGSALFHHAIYGALLHPHSVEAAVESVAHSSVHYATVESTSHHALEQHSWQPVHLYVVVAVWEEEEDWVAHF